MTSLKAFEITCIDGRTFQFESDSSAVQKKWLEGLRLAIDRVAVPWLHERVTIERRKRAELRKRIEFDAYLAKAKSVKLDD